MATGADLKRDHANKINILLAMLLRRNNLRLRDAGR
jgi:hypothetical protein